MYDNSFYPNYLLTMKRKEIKKYEIPWKDRDV